MNVAEKLYGFCDNYFYLGRRDFTTEKNWMNGGSKENIALCILRIASWAALFFSIPMGILYVASKYAKAAYDVPVKEDSELYRKWIKIIQLSVSGYSYMPKTNTEEERQNEMKKVHPDMLPFLINLFKNVDLDPKIKKIYISHDKPFDRDSSAFKNQYDDFIMNGDIFSLEGGGKAVAIRFPEDYNKDSGIDRYEKETRRFQEDGNLVYCMPFAEKDAWVNRRNRLPPDLVQLLTNPLA